jgi:hypothetical protein
MRPNPDRPPDLEAFAPADALAVRRHGPRGYVDDEHYRPWLRADAHPDLVGRFFAVVLVPFTVKPPLPVAAKRQWEAFCARSLNKHSIIHQPK